MGATTVALVGFEVAECCPDRPDAMRPAHVAHRYAPDAGVQRIASRRGMKERTAWLHHPHAGVEEAREVVDVLDHVERTDDIELIVGPGLTVLEGNAADVLQ